MFRVLFFCCALASASTAFSQQRIPVNGGSYVFVPDAGQIAPVPDQGIPPGVYHEEQTIIAPQAVYPPQQQIVAPQGHQHQGNCGCPVCRRRVLSEQTRIRSKTIKEYTTVRVVEEEHPVQIINAPVAQPMMAPRPNPCPPNPCIVPQPRPMDPCLTGGVRPWYQGFGFYRPPCPPQQGGRPMQQMPQQGPPVRYYGNSGGGRNLVSANVGVNVFGIGASTGVRVGTAPPYAQSGYGQPWYGGR